MTATPLMPTQPLDERGTLAVHPRARHDHVEAGRLRAARFDVDVDVRVEAERLRVVDVPPSASTSTSSGGQVDHEHVRLGTAARAASARVARHLVAARPQRALDVRSEQQVGAEQGDASHHCARRRRNSWRTDSGRPHSGTTSTRPERASVACSWPSMPSASSSASVPSTDSAAAAWPNVVGDAQAEVPVVLRVRLRVDLGEQRRGLDVALLVVEPQVQRAGGSSRAAASRRSRLKVVGECHGPEL